MTTNELTQAMIQVLETLGCYVWRQNTRVKGGRLRCTSKEGISDICAIDSYGIFVGVEIKRKGETLRPKQIEFRQEMLNRGAKYFTCRSPEDVAAIAKSI